MVKVIGILGGGQLGKMIAVAAANLGFRTHIYCPEKDSPAKYVTDKFTCKSYEDERSLEEFAKSVDIITLEFENIPSKTIEILNKFTKVRPSWECLYICQNRLREKNFARDLGLKTAEFRAVNSNAELLAAVKEISYPAILKTCEMGYDGKGQYSIKSEQDALNISNLNGSFILESYVKFVQEISVIVARNEVGNMICFPPAENIHKNGVLDTSTVPANISKETEQKAYEYSKKIAEKMGVVGLLAIEYFVTEAGELLVNEMAPRPHNSGHWTLDAAVTSQFEQMIRAILSLPFGSVAIKHKAVMTNLIGTDIDMWQELAENPNIKLHLYGKASVKEGRKMGHYTELFD